MSILGLCFTKDSNSKSDQLLHALKSFEILGSDKASYVSSVIDAGDYSCYFKYNEDSFINKISDYKDMIGNRLFLLGENWHIDNVLSRRESLNIIDEIDDIQNSDGEYNCIIIENYTNRIHFFNDRFSSRPSFYYSDGVNFLLSTNISFIVKYYRGVINYDLTGILQLLNFSHTLEQKTIYQNINRVQPATHMIIENGCVDMNCYWRIKYKDYKIDDIHSYAKEVIDAFKVNARKCTSQRSGFCSLSGGLDSRMVVASINSPGYFAFTFSDSLISGESKEVKVASEVASILGIRHKVLLLEDKTLSKYIKDIILLTGGLIPIQHPIKTMQQINEMIKGGRFKVGGGPGDVLAGSYVPSDTFTNASKRKKLVQAFALNQKMLSNKIMRRFLTKKVCQENLEDIIPTFLKSFDTINESTVAQQITIWAMKIRQPAFTFNSPIHNHPDISERSPHLGYRYCELMLQLPPKYLINKDFYHYMIYSQFPKLQNVIYANTGKIIESSLIDRKQDESLGIGQVRTWIINSIKKFLNRYPLLFVRVKKLINENYFMGRVVLKDKKCFLFDLLRADRDLLDDTKKILLESTRLEHVFMINHCISFIDGFCKGHVQYNKNLDAHIVGCLITIAFADKIQLDDSHE